MPSLTSVLTDMADYVKRTHVVVVDRIFGTVAIYDIEDGENHFFLQGEDAVDYIAESDRNWEESGEISLTTAYHATAKSYIDCL